ncbi:uncharacterized protein LOC124185936 [Neodiprion fabricii]|uniref:uncharacterized protein LOC124185936 n=1 Tax=Neodiprion fabricii TaxID=2872261 RepID=UPI001ED8CFE6|nr:uncharacterized protein LOC124185936 [Neodiprion fabricii]
MASLTKLSIIRLFELVMVCVMLGLEYHSLAASSNYTIMLTMGTIGGYLIILVGLFAATMMGTPVNRRVDLFFSVVGCVLFIIVGAVTIDYYQHVSNYQNLRDIGLSKGSIAVIEGVFFLVDAVFTFRGDA